MSRRKAGSLLKQFRKLNSLHITYLRYVGLWALDSDSSTLSKCLYFVYNKFVLIIMFIFMATLLADICANFNDLSIFTNDGCIFAGISVVFFKVMIFQIRREQIVQLLRESVDGCEQLCKFPVGPEDEILKKYLLYSRVIFYGFSTIAVCLMIGLLFLVPVEDGGLPVRAQYPFDTTKYPGHAVGYFVEACTVSFGLTAIMGIDSLHALNLCNLFLVQLEILSEHFKSCGSNYGMIDQREALDARYKISSTVEERNGKRDNYKLDEIRRCSSDDFVKRFRRSIRHHQRLLAVIDDFNKVFSSSMFVQMVSSTSMICLTGFQAALPNQAEGQSSNTYKFLIYLMAAFSQLFFICWVGNEVTHQSASLTQSQWFSGWSDELSAKTGRLINVSMILAKKTINLKAGVFYVLSMETFIAILKGSYSFFALLSTMQSDGNQ
ncbi:odorant receptor 83a-like [Anoplolepis gracilipes]|uniref:odorant receptor 83a-like n=1 Tax=Anoplolepis gracilipes TaxID=354296 RepID=UPI003B9E9162